MTTREAWVRIAEAVSRLLPESYFAVNEAAAELARAQAKHGPMHGPHEGYAVILEELDELWEEVRAQKHDKDAMRKEALQVAAMAIRFVVDVCQ